MNSTRSFEMTNGKITQTTRATVKLADWSKPALRIDTANTTATAKLMNHQAVLRQSIAIVVACVATFEIIIIHPARGHPRIILLVGNAKRPRAAGGRPVLRPPFRPGGGKFRIKWRKMPKRWRTITRPAVRFFLKVSFDPWFEGPASSSPWLGIVGGPGSPQHQPGPFAFRRKKIVSETPDPPPRGKIPFAGKFCRDPA